MPEGGGGGGVVVRETETEIPCAFLAGTLFAFRVARGEVRAVV